MRLAVLSISAVFMSGCSWLDGMLFSNNGYQYKTAYSHHASAQYAGHDPCVIYSPVQPVPTGCNPAQVTMANNQSTYTTGGYGSHASQASNVQSGVNDVGKVRKPKLRGTLSLGTEKSVSGTMFDPSLDHTDHIGANYTYTPLTERVVDIGTDRITTATYTSTIEKYVRPTLSIDDVYNTPSIIKGGVEYILSPKFTVFANAAYAHAEGTDDAPDSVQGTLRKTTSTQFIDPETRQPIGNPVIGGTALVNEQVAYRRHDFSDQRRVDLEVGGRHYFDPVSQTGGYKTLTPFVGANVGVSHVNEVTYKTNNFERYLRDAFEDNSKEFYENTNIINTPNTLYESAWLLNGGLTAGMEWQVTPATALALETGLKYTQSRDYVGGTSSDANIAVPVTLRGSFNF